MTAPTIVEARVGETLEFVVSSSGPDTGRVPALALSDGPPGAAFVDLGDGTRAFRWTPGAGDVGRAFATFEARRSGASDALTIATTAIEVSAAEVAPAPLEPGRFGAPPIRRLAERHGLRVGSAALQNAEVDMFSIPEADLYRSILAEEYDILTPENSLKMSEVQPRRGEFEFAGADRYVAFAEAEDMLVHGHVLLWHEQLPSWVAELGHPDHRDEMHEIMREHIATVVSRYRGRIAVWDVVNEALERDGTRRYDPWRNALGTEYLSEAFHIAREADPDATLIYNDYDIAYPGPKSDALLEMLRRELAAGTPIDGVGFQLHLNTGHEGLSLIAGNFRRFAELGLDLYITEFDVMTDWRKDPEQEAQRQARTYGRIVRICVEQPACKALQTWGLSDRYAWRGPVEGLPLDEDFEPKPAFREMQRALAETPPTPRR